MENQKNIIGVVISLFKWDTTQIEKVIMNDKQTIWSNNLLNIFLSLITFYSL